MILKMFLLSLLFTICPGKIYNDTTIDCNGSYWLYDTDTEKTSCIVVFDEGGSPSIYDNIIVTVIPF